MSAKTSAIAAAAATDMDNQELQKQVKKIDDAKKRAERESVFASYASVPRYEPSFRYGSKSVVVSFCPPDLVYNKPDDLDELHGLSVQMMVDKNEYATGRYSNDDQEYEYEDDNTEDFLDPSPLDSPYALDPAELSDIERNNKAALDKARKAIQGSVASAKAQTQGTELSPGSSEKPIQE